MTDRFSETGQEPGKKRTPFNWKPFIGFEATSGISSSCVCKPHGVSWPAPGVSWPAPGVSWPAPGLSWPAPGESGPAPGV